MHTLGFRASSCLPREPVPQMEERVENSKAATYLYFERFYKELFPPSTVMYQRQGLLACIQSGWFLIEYKSDSKINSLTQ
jgi:hypothetical protein